MLPVSPRHAGRALCAGLCALAGGAALGAQVALSPPEDLCPSREQVAAALVSTGAPVELVEAGAPAAASVQLRSEGGALEVTLDGQAKRYATASCPERAQAVAVHLALALETPEPPRAPPAWTVEGGALLDAARGPAWVARGQLRAVYAPGRWGASLGVGASSAYVQELGPARAQVRRFPVELAARGRLPLGRLELGAELGLRATVLAVRGEGEALESPGSATRVDFAALLAPYLQVPLGERWGLRLGTAVAYSPRALTLGAEPVGVLGTLPQWWFSAGLEAWVRVD